MSEDIDKAERFRKGVIIAAAIEYGGLLALIIIDLIGNILSSWSGGVPFGLCLLIMLYAFFFIPSILGACIVYCWSRRFSSDNTTAGTWGILTAVISPWIGLIVGKQTSFSMFIEFIKVNEPLSSEPILPNFQPLIIFILFIELIVIPALVIFIREVSMLSPDHRK